MADHVTKCSRTIVSELIGSVNTSAFPSTNPTDESITSGLPVIRQLEQTGA